MDTQKLDQTYIANTYARFPVTIVKGKGSLVWDDTGKEYIDLSTGIAVDIFGVADEEWMAAVTKQLGTLQHGDAAGLGSHQLRVVRQDCGGIDNQVSAFNIFRFLADGDGNTQFPLCIYRIGGIVVRAGDVISGCSQDLYQRVHTAAADPDKMNMLFPLEDIGIRNGIH